MSSFEGPFLEMEALEFIASAAWVEIELPDDMPLVDRRRLLDEEGPVLIDSSPELLRFVIPGGTCPPTVHVGIETREPLVLRLTIDDAVPPAGEECGEILRLHEFNVLLVEPTGEMGVDFVVRP